MSPPTVLRRARPLLGTLVDVGVVAHDGDAAAQAAVDAAFAAVARVGRAMSRQRPASDLSRLNAATAGTWTPLTADTRSVLARAAELHAATAGAFDVSGGTGCGSPGFALGTTGGWRTQAGVVLSLDGIAKGHAVDCAVIALQAHGCAAGWVNAGGDLRAFGAVTVPVTLRIGARARVVDVHDAALATSDFGRARTQRGAQRVQRRRDDYTGATVLARECIVADALTKVAVRRGQVLPAGYGASVLWHD
ncbi:MAG: FAD:protein FMN transferase [Proteobacteria bacterium]|nr:FAD:protein FMN transferase [Pseudomonadota bacterium]